MAAENFKVKKGLEVGTGITANSDGVNVTGIVTATQFKGDGSGLTGVTASGSGVIVKDEGSTVGTAATINFVGGGVAATLSAGIATVTINSGTTTINNNANNRLITGSGTANTLEGESGLTYDGTYLNHIGSGFKQLKIDTSTSNSASLLLKNQQGNFTVNTINNAGNRNFTIYDGTAGETRFSINQNGTVGITSGLNVTGVSTFASAIDANGDLDVDGQTNLDDVRISGVTTMTGTLQGNIGSFTGAVSGTTGTFSGNISGPQLNISASSGNDGIILLNSAGGQNNDFSRLKQDISDDTFKIENKASGSYESLFEGKGGAEVKLYFAGNQKLTTTINGIEVPDLNATGVGTFGRVDTNGVTLGTNNNTFAAKFIDDAVANFGTDNDLKISHNNTDAIFENTTGQFIFKDTAGEAEFKIQGHEGNSASLFLFADEGDDPADRWKATAHTDGNLVLNYFRGATSAYAKVAQFTTDAGTQLFHTTVKRFETTDHGVVVSGVCTATSFSGDGSGLTGITASGSGILVKHDGSNVGTAGTINFSTNLDVSPISAGIVTVTASGGGGGVSLANGVDNRVVTATGAAALNGEPNLTWDGTTLAVVSQQTVSGSVVVGSGVTIDARGINAVGTAVTAGRFHADGGSFRTQIGSGNQGFYMYNGDSTHLAISYSSSANRNQFRGNAAGDKPLWFEDFSYIRVSPKSAYVQLDYGESPKLVTDIAGVKITGICTATSFSGSGIGLTSLNADNLGSGEIPNGRFPATLPAVSGANLTSLNADNISSGTLATARIEDDAVTFDKLENVANSRILGRVSSGAGNAEELTATQVRTLLNVADGATAGITTAPSNITATWNVTASNASGYEFTGPGQDGSEDNPDIYLVRGHKYRFINTTGSSHPFRFRVSSGGSTYTDGISGSENGTQDFSVQHDAPASLVYQCTIHSGMVGNIYIVGQHLANGANNRVLTATSAYGMNGEANLTFDGTTLNCVAGVGPQIRFENQHSVTTDAVISTFDDATGTLLCLGSNFYMNSSGSETRYNTSEESAGIVINRNGSLNFLTGGTGATATGRFGIRSDGKVLLDNSDGTLTIGGDNVYDSAKINLMVGNSSQTSATTEATALVIHDLNSRRNGTEGAGSWKSKITFRSTQINGNYQSEGASIVHDITYNNYSSTKMRSDLVFKTRGDAQTAASDAATQKLRIEHNGRVKIGSGNASLALLHIEPTLYGINLQNDSNNKSRILFSKNSAGNDSRAWIEGNGELNGYISLAAGDDERLRIDGDEATFDGIINQGTPGGDIRHVVKSFGPAFLGNSSTADLTLDAGQGGGTVTVHSFRTSDNNLSRTSIFGFQLRGTGTASVGTTIYNQTGSAGDASFSVTAIAQGIRFTNNAGATVKYAVTFDLTGDL